MTICNSTIRNYLPVLLAATLLSPAIAIGAEKTDSPATADAPSTLLSIENSTHLVVGRSMFINTQNRLRRVYVSNPAVLDSFTASPHQIVVTAKTPGVSSLILWDENGESQVYLISSDVDVSELRHALKDALPYENVRAEGHEQDVALAGMVSSPEAADAAVKLAGMFSKNVANSLLVAPQHARQVRLKVRIIEIDRSRALDLGFNFFGTGKNTFNSTTGQFSAISVGPSTSAGGSSSGGGSSTTTGTSSLLALSSLLNLFYFNHDLGIGAAIQALQDKQILQVLAEPTITAMNGEKASFLAGGEFPYPVVQGSNGGTSVTIQFRPYGVRLDFMPIVLPDGTIQLKVAPEVSALDYTNSVSISGYVVPAISTRRAETQVELKTDQSFMISGLLDSRTTDQLSKIPGIGDIPILGNFFKSKGVQKSVTELAVIITPTLVDPLTENLPKPSEPNLPIPQITDSKFDKGIVPKSAQAPQGTVQK
ncbi:MAG: type II and III secretion system protein family protein [Silvibacterium sp.]|nr:type II and III secretion system protein family protein [Silvibacterium sp.]